MFARRSISKKTATGSAMKKKSNYVLKFLRPDLAFIQQLRYTKADRYTYRVITTSSCVPDSVTTWRGESQPLSPLVLELKGGKTVLLFRL